MKKDFSKEVGEMKKLLEISIQQKSGMDSDMKVKFAILETHYTEIKDKLSNIEAQTTKTNGRVSSLERWRSYFTGGGTVITVVIFVIVGLISYIFINSQQTVEAQIRQLTNQK